MYEENLRKQWRSKRNAEDDGEVGSRKEQKRMTTGSRKGDQVIGDVRKYREKHKDLGLPEIVQSYKNIKSKSSGHHW